MQRLSLTLVALLLLIEPVAQAGDHPGAKRFAITIGIGSFDEQGSDVNVADTGRQLLGVDDIDTGSQSSAGFGARIDYRFGRSACTIGANVGWMWKLSGDLFTITTTPDSLYSGTTLRHQGLNFVIGLSYHL